MTVTSVASGDAARLASAASSGADAASSDRFLKLLVTQMQNQDPLNPMDNAQVTSQMAQINTVSGIQQLNAAMQGLGSQLMQLQALQGASLVGREVTLPGNLLQTSDGVASGRFEIAAPADAVKVEMLDGAGRVVGSVDLGAQSAGAHRFEWNAAAAGGNAVRFRVAATAGGVALPATALMRDRVAAVNAGGDVLTLELARSGSVPYAQIKSFN